MNIARIMVPKTCTAFLVETNTVRQGLEKMRHYGYTAIPVLDEKGAYCGCVNEGDFLRHILNTGSAELSNQESYQIRDIMREEYVTPLRIMAPMAEVLEAAKEQNFIPIVDDRNCFCGIITRRSVIEYLAESVQEPAEEYMPCAIAAGI